MIMNIKIHIFCIKLLYVSSPELCPNCFANVLFFIDDVIREITVTNMSISLYLFPTKPSSLYDLGFVGNLLIKLWIYTITFFLVKLFYILVRLLQKGGL